MTMQLSFPFSSMPSVSAMPPMFASNKAAYMVPTTRTRRKSELAAVASNKGFTSGADSADNRAMNNGNSGDSKNSVTPAQKLRNRALRLLTTREHSREELMRKLAQAKARRVDVSRESESSKDDIERLVNDLSAQGWQSDDRYAEAIVRRLGGQVSKRYISEKLAQVGIKKDVAEVALATLDGQDEFAIAQALWQRRFGDVPEDDKARQRQIRYLLSRGFHLGDAFKIVPKAPIDSDAPKRFGWGRGAGKAPKSNNRWGRGSGSGSNSDEASHEEGEA